MNAPAALPSLGRIPLLFPILGVLVGIFTAEIAAWPLLVGLVAASIHLGLWTNQRPLIVGAILALILAVVHHSRLQKRAELASQIQQGLEMPLRGTLVESNATGLVRRLFKTKGGAHVILQELPPRFQTGQKLALIVNPLPERQARNPQGWDPAETIWRKGIAGKVEVISAAPRGWAGGFPALRGLSERIRSVFTTRVTQGISNRESADIVRAVVLGEKTSGSNAFGDFRRTGTMHVFAVSGLHVGLVALIVFGLGWVLRLPPRVLLWVTILAMFGYAFITGLRPPALRAAVMGSLILGRFLLLRRPSGVNNLFAAALIVLSLNSFQVWQAGFQLSFLVVGIILLIEPHLWKRLAPRLALDPFLPKPVWTPWQSASQWLRNKVGKMFTVSLAAWFGSAPLSLLYFGWFTPIASLASVLMVCFAFLILAIAFLSLTLGSIVPAAGPFLNQANGLIATGARHSAQWMGSLPGAWHRYQPTPAWKDGLCVFDIRYGGAAIHLDIGGGVLIDGGYQSAFAWEVQPALEAHGLSINSIVATHNDSRHISGLTNALGDYPIEQALIPKEEANYSLADLVASCRAQEITLHDARGADKLPLHDQAYLEILHPGSPEQGRADDRGLVLLLHHHGWRILITADAGYHTEQTLLAQNTDLRADLWICGRNKLDTMGSDAFVRAVSPRVIIATEQAYAAEEKIPLSWRRWLESEGIVFFSQREHGAVFVVPQKDQLHVKGFLTDREMTLKR